MCIARFSLFPFRTWGTGSHSAAGYVDNETTCHAVHRLIFSKALLLIQIVHIVTLHDLIKRFDFGYSGGVTAAALCASIVAGEGLRLQKTNDLRKFNIFLVLDAVQLVAGLFTFFSCWFIPRRPSVVHNGYPVDDQYTVSSFGRYTFTWAGKILKLASVKKTLTLDDVPRLHHQIRSSYLERHFSGLRKEKGHLLKLLLLNHWQELSFVTFFSIGMSVAQFAPQLVMFALLKLLEQRAEVPGLREQHGLWFWHSAWPCWSLRGAKPGTTG